MARRAQTLLLVLFLLVLAGVLVAGLAGMWQAEISMRSLERDGLIAFYLAQAGIERAKVELENNWDWGGMDTNNDDVADNSEKISLGDGTYWCDIVSRDETGAPTDRRATLKAHGWVRDAHRVIQVELEQIASGDPPTYNYSQVAGSWEEI